ncbi:MAG: MBL fold metallo-hydrolase [Desulfobacterales bacterium]|nr:MBL fold metallo-hydrolase [Desulfobacterales bacterium]
MSIIIKWLGTAGLEFTANGQTLLIDPFISRPGKIKHLLFPLTPDEKVINNYLSGISGELKGVLIGHTHSDHVMDAPLLIKKFECNAYGTTSLANLLSAYNLEQHSVIVEYGKEINIGEFNVIPIKSKHGRVIFGKIPLEGEISKGLIPPLRVNKYREGGTIIWQICIGGKKYLHIGSADFIEENLKGFESDVLFICIVGRQNTKDFTKKIIDLVKPKIIVPIHFDDFFVPLTPNKVKYLSGVKINQFLDEIKVLAPNIDVIVPEPLKSMLF